MNTVRRSGARRHVHHGTQDTWSSFDAGSAEFPGGGFRGLAILNEEKLPPGSGFTLQAPRPLELVTYVREGLLLNQSSSGRAATIGAGEFNCVSLDKEGRRRAVNGSLTDRVHAFQCCFTGKETLGKPTDDQKRFSPAERKGVFRLVAAGGRKRGSINLHHDVRLYSSVVETGTRMVHEIGSGRAAWPHIVKGRIRLGEHSLRAGDGVGLVEEATLSFTAQEASEVLLFNLE